MAQWTIKFGKYIKSHQKQQKMSNNRSDGDTNAVQKARSPKSTEFQYNIEFTESGQISVELNFPLLIIFYQIFHG